MSNSIICIFPQSVLPAIDVVQNIYSDLNLSQEIDLGGSIWTRSISQFLALEQDFSDFYANSVETVLGFSSTATSQTILTSDGVSTIDFVQTVLVAGGRIGSSSSSGATGSLFSVIYNEDGPTATKGLWVYVDSVDGEAKLASFNGAESVAEVVGSLNDNYVAGADAEIITEGELARADWTSVAGTEFLTRGVTYYLAAGGQMSVTPPSTGHIVILGRAITGTKFDIEISEPWVAN